MFKVLKFKSLREMQEFFVGDDSDKTEVYQQLVSAIEHGNKTNQSIVNFAEVIGEDGEDQYVFEMNREDWPDTLESALEYFESVEEYEMCKMVTELMSEI